MHSRFSSFVLGAGLCIASSIVAHADPALLGNKKLADQKLDDDGVKAVLLGKKVSLGGDRVILVIAKNSETQEAYLKQHVGMSTDQFQTYWRRLFMTGAAAAPKFVDTEDDAIKLVNGTAGAVAVGDSSKADGLAVLAGK